MVRPAGFEPAIFALRGRCPEPLDEGRLFEICDQDCDDRGEANRSTK